MSHESPDIDPNSSHFPDNTQALNQNVDLKLQNESVMHLGGLAPSASHESPDIDPKSSHLPDEHIGSNFHNSEGECPLFQPHVIVTGHHQPAGVIGLRTAMVRMAGWTLQLVVIYLDSNFEIGQGPNKERTEHALQCVMTAKVPWLIIGDFNRSPEEVANSAWCKFLRSCSNT